MYKINVCICTYILSCQIYKYQMQHLAIVLYKKQKASHKHTHYATLIMYKNYLVRFIRVCDCSIRVNQSICTWCVECNPA